MPESRSRKKKTYTPPTTAGASAPKGNPAWLVPVMVGLMVAGLAWLVVTYISGAEWPIPGIGNGNLAVGFALVIAGFALTTRWR
ncbi:cell division protein CrgA [Actinotalea sp. M2MS4P-6]|uniref:cell division protein CrgA n=1 Tax=Actinotalea sp. M2MS4P-6 TaxID=2983762 RepID=UPI0021E41449|nr:cell division protein CrgA [Actinotalea sp. M2MS4P-6]MCV2392829.1 cell division protein CrgA [Actinotalea sp. M2MS4P-6]